MRYLILLNCNVSSYVFLPEKRHIFAVDDQQALLSATTGTCAINVFGVCGG